MRKISVVIILLAIAAFGLFIWWQNGIKAPSPANQQESIFVINKGENVREIGNDLKEAGFIKDPVVFFLYVKKEGIDTEIQAGSYRLSPSMTLPQVIETLQHGTIDVWITIPEGFRAEEIADVLKDSISSYNDLWIAILKENEGYLFPDTYLIPHEAEVEQVVSIMRNNFNAKIESIGLSTNSPNLDRLVTIASLIEREALTDEEKSLIASVIQNRLNSGMALDIDATLQYIKGKNADGSWWSVPTASDRQINSPYNTYRNPGLPPAPIANPGIAAIQAALNPSESSYYFYLHDTNGNIHFSETLEEHNGKVNKYLR